MKTSARTRQVVALALTWDGARWPVRLLPSKARAFLREGATPSARSLGKLFADDQVKELRICWVPALKGGGDVLAESFAPVDGKRLAFSGTKPKQFGDVLGVVYRRTALRLSEN